MNHQNRTRIGLTTLSCWIVGVSMMDTAIAYGIAPPQPASNPAGHPEQDVIAQLRDYLSADPEDRGHLVERSFGMQPLTKQQAVEATRLLVEHHHRRIRENRREEHTARLLILGDRKMPYEVRVFGERPESGHSLHISMHGGGGAPRRVNDQQWENQKRLYSLEEGVYVAPRAPTDTWNMWHQAHIDAFFTRLIENMIAFEGIDPDRVYLMGYSAGGDGVYQLAPRMADRLAAAAMMAGHPNDAMPDGLRNLPFTLHMGENDSAYQRNTVAKQWAKMLHERNQQDPGGYVHWVEIHADKGHWMDRQDAAGVRWMAQFRRNLIPQRIVWLQDDVVHRRFHWLGIGDQDPIARHRVEAIRKGNTIEILHSDPDSLKIYFRDDMLDMDQEITVLWEGDVVFQGEVPRTLAVIQSTLMDRGDPIAIFTGEEIVPIRTSNQ